MIARRHRPAERRAGSDSAMAPGPGTKRPMPAASGVGAARPTRSCSASMLAQGGVNVTVLHGQGFFQRFFAERLFDASNESEPLRRVVGADAEQAVGRAAAGLEGEGGRVCPARAARWSSWWRRTGAPDGPPGRSRQTASGYIHRRRWSLMQARVAHLLRAAAFDDVAEAGQLAAVDVGGPVGDRVAHAGLGRQRHHGVEPHSAEQR